MKWVGVGIAFLGMFGLPAFANPDAAVAIAIICFFPALILAMAAAEL